MKNLKELIFELNKNFGVIWHFNVSDISMIYGVLNAAKKLNKPVIFGVSEGERKFFGVNQIASIIKSLKEEYSTPIFLNADHTNSFESAKEVIDVGFDSITFDRGELFLEENILETKKVINYAKSVNKNVLIEGELGYIGAHSRVMEEIEGNDILNNLKYTEVDEALKFVSETGVDLLAPAVGNVHGIIMRDGEVSNPRLLISRIKEIKQKINIPLVLHGGSGIPQNDLKEAIHNGINIIHISTELRRAWKDELKKSLDENNTEYAPYKIYEPVVLKISEIVSSYLNLTDN